MKQWIVHWEPEMIEMALVEDDRLVEYAAEQSRQQSVVGSFYKGRVVNVLPGMQAAFVDIGLKKNAFLYVDDVLHPHLEKQPKIKPSIAELLTVGQELVVQVMKEPRGSKGARVTTHFSLPGRFIVFMPNSDYVAVSKKISSEAEKNRLKSIAERLRQGEEGIIMRTVSEDEPAEAVLGDLNWLRKEWERICERAEGETSPSLLHRDLGILQRFIRDAFDPGLDELVIDREQAAEEAERYLADVLPGSRNAVRVYKEKTPIFQAYGVEEQLKKSFSRSVSLAGGGTIVFDQTEALTVIDVNTAKYIGVDSFEDTIRETNLAAAREIALMLRLRDIGGIIIVDFIDMEKDDHRREVIAAMEEGLRKDRTKSYVVGWTRLGLLEMTRKKVRESTLNPHARICRACGGSGKA